MKQKRIRDYGISIGTLSLGKLNKITDVPGVKVGNVTLTDGQMQTGVTAILPHTGNLFQEKVLAVSHTINGFGKTVGTVQIQEMGTIETPIILTNTLSVGVASDALVEYMLDRNEDIGVTTGTVNPVVGECNDGYLNDIRGRHITRKHVVQAIEQAESEFAEGAVGAGTGMSCFGLKGGIGSASRRFTIGDGDYTLGVLVLANFGRQQDLVIDRIEAGKLIARKQQASIGAADRGSIIIVVATDLPVVERQLKRICQRTVVGLSRTGSYIGSGSGDLVIGFTTATTIGHYESEPIRSLKMLNENLIDLPFRAVAEATEEAILNALICAKTTKGRDGHIRHSLQEYMDIILGSR